MDSAWEQYKLEARKMLENGDESHLSSARGVGRQPCKPTESIAVYSSILLELLAIMLALNILALDI